MLIIWIQIYVAIGIIKIRLFQFTICTIQCVNYGLVNLHEVSSKFLLSEIWYYMLQKDGVIVTHQHINLHLQCIYYNQTIIFTLPLEFILERMYRYFKTHYVCGFERFRSWFESSSGRKGVCFCYILQRQGLSELWDEINYQLKENEHYQIT